MLVRGRQAGEDRFVIATAASGRLVEAILALTAAIPLVLAGLRGRLRADQLRLLGWSALVVLASHLSTSAPLVLGIEQPAGLYWNWTGKATCLLVIALLIRVLPAGTL